ncbi:CpsD/CapB family tyrosine-protein kinase [Metallumcola ferriviriculae]|uniref:non-specific protein-tyrosine kinase n=1 Tax=Metallumcola ferriviriculae TaxID=3039180 RepID=A0AAU0UJH6_9FIRM|nr:CpsD/CapB family tyrosine-protein kinase [Desulfitibacteraceae bacterium MK1]
MATTHNTLLVTKDNPSSLTAEAYRTLRTNLSFVGADHPCRCLLFTSGHPRVGKSTIAANLSFILAQTDKKVLLVDCDLRKPSLHKLFNLNNSSGLTNILSQNKSIPELAHNVTDGLWVLTSGPIPPNPSELISSNTAKQFWAEATETFDYTLIDSPPVLAVSDALVLSKQADGVIIVLDARSTRIDSAKEVKARFSQAGATVLGVVLNRVKLNKKDSQYYYK